ncbi:class I SAM-dependent methyltransferase [Chelativorans sp. Marseille-P2723]|uniref:SAM-dependent methyltransferase n=1 Tax=Chelativorans sp. Marseille-P2723 TaxID=2709133 RepID=UPI00156FF944|nr:class I SAM-dependent methyltransferase [Chelativorans sp. Marseille-P2723]
MFRDLLDEIDNYSAEPERYLDVPFVPTDEEAVDAMLKLAKVGSKDVLYDLGSGDGRIVIAAAKERNARAIGVEIDPVRIADAMEYAGWAGVEYLVDFIEEDIFTADIREATVVTLYLLESVNAQLRPRLLNELRPGTRVISHAFHMGDWKADDWIKLNGTTIYKWIVPAKVAGVWEWKRANGERYRVKLRQKYQEVSGEAWLGDKKLHVESAELCGPRLDLELQEDKFGPPMRFRLNFPDHRLHSVAVR